MVADDGVHSQNTQPWQEVSPDALSSFVILCCNLQVSFHQVSINFVSPSTLVECDLPKVKLKLAAVSLTISSCLTHHKTIRAHLGRSQVVGVRLIIPLQYH